MSCRTTKLAAILASFLLGGCSVYSLQELRQATPQGTPFQTALAQLYMDFASQEEKDYDWASSWHFADKGLLAIYGKDTAPEDLKNWDLPAEVLPDMEKARAELVAVLTPEIEKAQPEMAAKAQFNFDCWVEQQEEDWQQEDITTCRENLMTALTQLHAPIIPHPSAAKKNPEESKPQEVAQAKAEEAPSAEPAGGPAAEETPAVAEETAAPPVKKAQAPETISYIVFFESGQSSISASGNRVIDEVIKTITGGDNNYEVLINGHADDPGGEKANLELSQARVEAVKGRLLEGGVKEKSIKTFAYGNSDPKFKTRKGQEPGNRRVEIFLNE